MPRNNNGAPCQVCGKPSIARSLCQRHYRRWQRHGHVFDTRPKDWGARESHPLYGQWSWTGRTKPRRDAEWDDFYNFVSTVGERPSDKHRLKRRDITKGFGPDNWYWKDQIVVCPKALKDKSEYQRQWREKNKLKTKGYDLKRHFNMTIEEYSEMLEAQKGVCSICEKPEHVMDGNGVIRSLAVDHCHVNGYVRGLLCTNCNKAIGHLKDNPDLLVRAIEYLTTWSK